MGHWSPGLTLPFDGIILKLRKNVEKHSDCMNVTNHSEYKTNWSEATVLQSYVTYEFSLKKYI